MTQYLQTKDLLKLGYIATYLISKTYQKDKVASNDMTFEIVWEVKVAFGINKSMNHA